MHRGVPRVVNSFLAAKDSLAHIMQAPAEGVIFENGQWSTPFTAGDLLISIDSWWALDHYQNLAAVRASGAMVATVVYDLIPITHTELLTPAIRDAFMLALTGAIQNSDFLMCISQTVKNDLLAFIHHQAIPNPPKADYFYLGSHFEPAFFSAATTESNDSAMGEFALTVGAIEPRKGYVELLECFQYLWKNHTSLKLVIVGGWADRTEEVREIIRAVNATHSHILHLEAVSDERLEQLYATAKYVICPSLAEGFGLPLIEAIARKKIVLANSTPIFKEIGQDYPDYFNVHNPIDFAQALGRAELRQYRTEPVATLISWEESVKTFGSKLAAL